MPRIFGYSVYLSSYQKQIEHLEKLKVNDGYIFISLHISEEFDDSYCERAYECCRELKNRNFKIIADVSIKTLEQFGTDSLIDLKAKLNIWALRIDYGLSETEISALAKETPLVLNASTIDKAFVKQLVDSGANILAMHNFYPRVDTGLDGQTLQEKTKELQDLGVKVLAFIPGDEELRGPIFEGLPTLEKHRYEKPYLAAVDFFINYKMDGVFIGDLIISHKQISLIKEYLEKDVIQIPAILDKESSDIYDKTYTNRIDSPRTLIRFEESRMYANPGDKIEACNCVERSRGSITLDNYQYQRYSGEIQITKVDFPTDQKVNVIGKVADEYIRLIDCVDGGQKFKLIQNKNK